MTRQIALFSALFAVGTAMLGWTLWKAHVIGANWPVTGADAGYSVVDLKGICTSPKPYVAGSDAVAADLRRLDGWAVRLEGCIYGVDASQDRVRTFLMSDHTGWGGGCPTDAWEHVRCTLSGGRSMIDPGRDTPLQVYGTLHVGARRDDDGRIYSMFQLDVDHVTAVR